MKRESARRFFGAVLLALALALALPAQAAEKDGPGGESTITGTVLRNKDIPGNARYFIQDSHGIGYFLGSERSISLNFKLFLDKAVTNGDCVSVTGIFDSKGGENALEPGSVSSYEVVE